MKNILSKVIVICILTLALSLGFTSFAFADADFYLGISGVNNTINTEEDFIYIFDTDEYFYVPTLESGDGFAITFGIDFSDSVLEFGFTTSSHDGDYQGDPLDAIYNIFDINFKKFIGHSEHFRPYCLVGLCATSLTIEDGVWDYFYKEYGDAKYSGVGLNIGAGLELKILPSMSFKGEYIYRLVKYTSADGIDTSNVLDLFDEFGGSGPSINVGINFYF